jgi:cell division protein FtsN
LNLAQQKKLQQELERNNQTPDTQTFAVEATKASETKQVLVPEIVYKIQIGSFKGKIPESSNKMIKKLSMLRKVESYTDEKGYKIFTTGNLKTMNEATTLQNQVRQEGVKNPVIIAFQKGKRILLSDNKSKK